MIVERLRQFIVYGKSEIEDTMRARGHARLASKAKPADTLINIRCPEHVTFRCDRVDRWPDVRKAHNRSSHEKHTNASASLLSVRISFHIAFVLPRCHCFQECRVMSRRSAIIHDESHQHTRTHTRLDLAHVTRIYPSAFLSSSSQFSKVHRALMTEKTELIRPGRICVRDEKGGAQAIVADWNTP